MRRETPDLIRTVTHDGCVYRIRLLWWTPHDQPHHWTAHHERRADGAQIGTGLTEDEAIVDFLNQHKPGK